MIARTTENHHERHAKTMSDDQTVEAEEGKAEVQERQQRVEDRKDQLEVDDEPIRES